jgi:electron transport complex protein RnfA
MEALQVYILTVLSMVFVQNYVLARFLGLCPFLGVSKRTHAAVGMGVAVTFVMTLASGVTWFIFNYALASQARAAEFGRANLFYQLGLIGEHTDLTLVLKVPAYILVIATFVQLVEMFLRKSVPALYEALGIYLPLITTNCAVLGVALLNTTDYFGSTPLSFFGALLQGAAAGLGFMLAMLLMSGIRERLVLARVPEAMKGVPIAFVCTGLMALSFLGFTGMITNQDLEFKKAGAERTEAPAPPPVARLPGDA